MKPIGHVFSGQSFSTDRSAPGVQKFWCATKSPIDASSRLTIAVSPDGKTTLIDTPIVAGQTLLGMNRPVWSYPRTAYPGPELSSFESLGCKKDDREMALIARLSGPVEFDRTFYFIKNCENGKASFYLTGNYADTTEQFAIPLTCEKKKKSTA